MRKFWSVVKHEYKKLVLKWTFLVATLLFPVLAAGFALVPALLFSIKGEPTRLVIVDETGKIGARVRQNLLTDRKKKDANQAVSQEEQMRQAAEELSERFVFVEYAAEGKSVEQIKRELSGKITAKEIDAYLIVPTDYDAAAARFEFFSRKAGDILSSSLFERSVNNAVRSQRLADANISEDRLKDLSRPIDFSTTTVSEAGDEKAGDEIFAAAFVVGLMIYITLLIYGQQIMAAVIEEKETRIAEILFSSAKPFELMMGKLVGVGLAGMTQLAIWLLSVLVLAGVGLASVTMATMNLSLPAISPLIVVYFFVFFILGFFIYATIYALIGSMVTTVQEGGQFAMFPVIILVIGFYMTFMVIRDPNSNLAFWVSIAPFFAPITMPVRILAETPPFWQIGISIILNAAAIAGLIWLAARVYRVGMLMYGKKATIPEVWKWIRQS